MGEGTEDKYLDFRRKRFQLQHRLTGAFGAGVHSAQGSAEQLRLEVKRSDVLFTSFQAFRGVMGQELKKRLNIQYEGEEGIDSGGITKEWYLDLSRAFLSAEHGMFTKTEEGLYVVDARSGRANPSTHIQYFHFFGRLLGKAIRDSTLVDVPLCPVMYGENEGKEEQRSVSSLY